MVKKQVLGVWSVVGCLDCIIRDASENDVIGKENEKWKKRNKATCAQDLPTWGLVARVMRM